MCCYSLKEKQHSLQTLSCHCLNHTKIVLHHLHTLRQTYEISPCHTDWHSLLVWNIFNLQFLPLSLCNKHPHINTHMFCPPALTDLLTSLITSKLLYLRRHEWLADLDRVWHCTVMLQSIVVSVKMPQIYPLRHRYISRSGMIQCRKTCQNVLEWMDIVVSKGVGVKTHTHTQMCIHASKETQNKVKIQ